MENEFIRKQMRVCTYHLKQGTKSSYYFSGGERLLPNRVGITPDGFTQVRKKGRNLRRRDERRLLDFFVRRDRDISIRQFYI